MSQVKASGCGLDRKWRGYRIAKGPEAREYEQFNMVSAYERKGTIGGSGSRLQKT